MALDHLIGDSLEVPGPLADPVRPDGELDHVVLADGAQGLRCRVVCRGPVLQEAHSLLSRGQGVHHEAEGGGLTFWLLPTPSLTLVQRQVPDTSQSAGSDIGTCSHLIV